MLLTTSILTLTTSKGQNKDIWYTISNMSDNKIPEHKISRGYDRGADYLDMKSKLITDFTATYNRYVHNKNKTRVGNTLIYIIVAMIQLRNGSRIIEAVNALRNFTINGCDDLTVVKIAKSGGIKYKTVDGVTKKVQSKVKFRKMMFPEAWISVNHKIKIIKKLKVSHQKVFDKPDKIIKKRVYSYLLRKYKINTHSLRYAFINHMIHEEKTPLNEVAKFVGHSSIDQIVRYTQQKQCDKIFKMDHL